MAVRLPVIMIQAAPGSGAAQQLSEAVVGEAIGLPGIDVTLVDRWSQLHEHSTDRLTLHGLSGDAAVLDWQSPEAIVRSLAEVGFEGHRAPHAHDPAVAPVPHGARRIYAFDLRDFTTGKQVAGALVELNASRQVRTFSLGIADATPKPPPASAARPIRATPETRSRDAEKPQPAAEGESLNLDDLLDELDRLDP